MSAPENQSIKLDEFLQSVQSAVTDMGHECKITTYDYEDFYSVEQEKINQLHILYIDGTQIGFYWDSYNPELNTHYLNFSEKDIKGTTTESHIDKAQLENPDAKVKFIKDKETGLSVLESFNQSFDMFHLNNDFHRYSQMSPIVVATDMTIANKTNIHCDFFLF